MSLRTAVAGVLLAIAALSAQAQTAKYEIKDVRFWPLGDITRIAVETTGEVSFKYNRLSKPERLYFDLENTAPRQTQPETIEVGNSIVQRLRVARTQPTVTRVVVDLSGPAEFSASHLVNPDRLVIEIRKAKSGPGPRPRITTTAPEPADNPAPALAASRPKQDDAASRPTPGDNAALAVAASRPKLDVAASRPKLDDNETLTVANTTPTVATPRPTPAATAPAEPAEVRVAKPAASGRSLTRALGLKLRRVVLDAGHGGHDTGTISNRGLVEKDLVLDVTRRLGTLIEKRLGSEVIYTREGDTFLALEERPALANKQKADLFLSIHANSSSYKNIVGVETFYLSFSERKADLDVAARENASSEKSINQLSDLVQRIAFNDKLSESREFAAKVQSAGHAMTVKTHGKVRDRGVKKAPFVVLIGAEMPSVLVEIGFLTNSKEEKLMGQAEHRQKIAEALYQGVAGYADTLSHFTVAQTGGGVTAGASK
jgi:N-acetylmuramoyl-L-alanine amidase